MYKYFKIVIAIIVVGMLEGGASAVPIEQWTKTFGGVKDDYWASSVQQTSDGGYILAGRTYSYGAGNDDAWVIKVDSGGNKQWSRTFGGTGNDYAYSVQQTLDGGYILAGSTNSFGEYNAWLIKTDSNGNDEWDSTFGGEGNSAASSVQQTLDGGYILAASTNSYGAGHSNAWLIKTDAKGNELWNRTFEGTSSSGTSSAQQTMDGGYIIAGWTDSYEDGRRSAWLVKINTNGIEQWNRTFVRDDYAEASSVRQTSDGGYILAGRSGIDNVDAWLVKTDSNGIKLWDRTFGGTYDDIASSVQQAADGGYILAGGTWRHIIRPVSLSKAWLIKTDANGTEGWNMTFGGTRNDWASSVQQTKDGGYIIAGYTNSYGIAADAWLRKVSGEQTGTAKTQDASPTVKTSPTVTLTASPTRTMTVIPTENHTEKPFEKVAGFEAVLAIAILLVVNLAGRRRW